MSMGGGVLGTILDALADAIPESGGGVEPLVLEGTYSAEDYNLILNEGSPSYQDIVTTLNSGATVYVKAKNEVEEENFFVFAGINYLGIINFTCVDFGGTSLYLRE